MKNFISSGLWGLALAYTLQWIDSRVSTDTPKEDEG
ncbi:hypothetical protein GGQ84_000686 [Desulfitispora alkaliphila]